MALTGRPIDQVIGEVSAYKLALPSGEESTPDRLPGQAERREGLSGPVWKGVPSGQPEGVVVVDPNDVLALDELNAYRAPTQDRPATVEMPWPFK